ncbi:MAG: hypothetical protein E7006_02755 [Alphaproteobacteria bacterium]|nr:hypothetical protein [Alphaproteobacteria bacterium]
MKKSLSGIVGILVAFGVFAANADTNWGARSGSVAKLDGAPAVREQQNVNYEKYQTRTLTRTYESTDGGDLYYVKPANRSALYKQYDAANSSSARAVKTTKRQSRSEKVVAKMKRKYYLAHPFFQPLQGKFGSVTDLSYTSGKFDFELNQVVPVYDGETPKYPLTGVGGEWKNNNLAIKEDFSYGITDRVALVGMLQYNAAESEVDWGQSGPSESMDDSSLNLFGLGAQWRFVDNADWIATVSGYYQHQKDVSNNIILDLKAGYKVAQSTIYGLGRAWYLDLEGNSYGSFIEGTDADGVYAATYIPYQVGESEIMYFEAGLGVFSVLQEDWTLNLEAVFGNYDWHNSATIKGAIGWQPNDWFALNLYAKTSFYDNADGKNLGLYWMEPNIGFDALQKIGSAKVDNSSETSIGVQAIFQF